MCFITWHIFHSDDQSKLLALYNSANLGSYISCHFARIYSTTTLSTVWFRHKIISLVLLDICIYNNIKVSLKSPDLTWRWTFGIKAHEAIICSQLLCPNHFNTCCNLC